MTKTRKYKAIHCYQCGEPMQSGTFTEVWDMRIDNKMHKVPVYAVPCHRCPDCNIDLTDDSSDAVIQHWYVEYLNANNLNTPCLRLRRAVRRLWHRIESRYNLWQLRRMKANDKR